MAVKKKVSQALRTAKDSLRLLGALEKETRAKAREYVNSQHPNDRLLAGLERIGVATQKQIQAIEARLAALEEKFKE